MYKTFPIFNFTESQYKLLKQFDCAWHLFNKYRISE